MQFGMLLHISSQSRWNQDLVHWLQRAPNKAETRTSEKACVNIGHHDHNYALKPIVLYM